MEHIFCGIKFPAPRNYDRVRVDNVNFNENTATLKEKIKNEVLFSNCEFSLVYCGNILEDDEPISKYASNTGITIHLIKKAMVEEDISEACNQKFTELDVSRVVSYFRALNSGNFHKISRPEVIKAIFNKHPELQKDIVALSILKDPILLSNMQNPDTVRKMAENHRILVEAAEDICKALKSVKTTQVEPIAVQPNFDQDFSDSSSSSSEGTSPRQASTSSAAGRRITSELLRRSLAAAAQSNENSLANISQRNLSQGLSPSTSSPSSSAPSSSAGRRNIISSSMFLDAMNEVLRSRRSEANATIASPENNQAITEEVAAVMPAPIEDEQMENDEENRQTQNERDEEMIASFQIQLRQMEDMGLTNKAANIQALMVCNGNLEAAVNLVLAEMNMS